MSVQEVCEPLFHEMCRLNRLARKGGGSGTEMNRVRAQIRAIFDEMKASAAADVGLSNQYAEAEKPLVYFVDFMISESAFPWANEWPPFEEEVYGELVGQTRFFELLDETRADPSPAATDRLEIYYQCLGLGFTGFYSDEPEYLRRKMLEIQGRIKKRVDLQSTEKFVPESELYVNTSQLYEPPSPRLIMMGIALVGLIVVLFVANYWVYWSSESRLTRDLDDIAASSEADGTEE